MPLFGVNDYIPGIDSCLSLIDQASNFSPTKNEDVRRIEDFKLTKEIRRTASMSMHLAYDKKEKSGGVTLLLYVKMGFQEQMPLLKETTLLRTLKHKNIFELYGTVHQVSVGRVYLSFEQCECFLSNLLSDKHKELLEPSVIKCVMQQLLTGLQYLHDNKIVHRDINPKNIVFTEKGLLKLFNFRSSQTLNEYKKVSFAEELCYQPINVLMEDDSFYTADDIWSATCVFAEMVLKKKLFESILQGEVIKEILLVLGFPDENKWPEFLELPNYKYLSIETRPLKNWLCTFFEEKQCVDLVKRGLCYNPKQRISAGELLLHPYFLEEPLAIDEKSFCLKLHGRGYEFPIK
ncbi:hypothetical protein JTE90_022413 [Oedothorax gibbosus]|uniref:Protein kinase domain-containing protein n=1 Tax=Oedothorax gibbosus TaxID=931172 RepID=A0AAV6U3X4_9ARAC|nr:hypothetical protein JTE90_022413 [Oedothorax gibbosus]